MAKKMLDLFLTFIKIGMFTFGGGYAMISMIEHNCVERKGWITYDEMMEITVIAESTPGSVAINCATYVGYKKGKLLGSLVATLGVILPSFAIIFIISKFFNNYLEITAIASAFKGIKIAVGFLIFDAAVKMIKKSKPKAMTLVIMVGSFTAMLLIDLFSWNFSSISLMLIAGAVSLAIFLLQSRKHALKEGE